MAPAQATLGKFFPNPNGTKASESLQQSKLSFGKPKVKTEAGKENAPNDQHPAEDNDKASAEVKAEPATQDMPDVKHEEVKAEPATQEMPDAEQEASDVQMESSPAAAPPSTGDKRPVSENEQSETESEDDMPTRKRRKQDVAEAKPSKAKAATAKAEKPKKQESKKVVGKSKGATASSAKAAVEESEESNDEQPSARVEQPEEEAESEEEEDEKPEVVAKARAAVQSSLKDIKKDPYSDWKAGEPVPYAALCTTFSKIEMTTKRLEILAHCSLFLRQVLRLTPKDLLPVVQLMIGKLAADYAGIELGIGESLIMKAIGETTGRSLAIIKTDQKEIGDLGLVAAKSRSNQPTMFKPKALTVRGVHEGLMAIALVEGSGSQGRKVAGIKKLLSSADVDAAGKGSKGVDITKDKGGASESKFIIRTLEGKMRLGLADKTILVALAQAMVIHEVLQQSNKVPSTDQMEKGEKTLKSVYSELPSYEVIIPAMLEHGIFNLQDNCKLQPGVPLKPMLAKPTKSITEVLDRFEGKDFTCEYKYDGERAQIHYVAHDSTQEFKTAVPQAGKSDKGIANIFSRNSEDLSKKYPDILQRLPSWVKDGTKSFVLDCETVAWDVKEKKVLPFQQLMTRKRKDVKLEDITVKVKIFAFDLLFLNGEALVKKPFRERRELLQKSLNEVEGEFAFAQYGNTNQLDEIQTLLDDSVKASCEGLMVKMLDGVESNYEPSRRSQNWLKVKKDYLTGIGDSLDLVVLGAYFGRGKRTSVYGAFLLACYNPSSQCYETVCNIGTGFSEAILEQFHTQFEPHAIERPKPFYTHSDGNKDQPDVWFEPKFVWEVKTADLTLSPRYKAAADQSLIALHGHGKGISLRFPRFIQQRDDKKPDQATTSRQVAEMYQKQESVTGAKGPAADDDFEY